jgi:hypothetical protein
MHVNLIEEKDSFIWSLTSSGSFTLKSMYLDLLDDQTKYLCKYIWKIKVPLKIKIFMWFLHRKVILTKDNLAKRNWEGSKTCVFCDKDESIQHLFFECPLAKTVWRIIFLAFSISPPSNITNLFGNWLSGIAKKDLIQIRVGVCAIVWAIWNVRNDFIFNKQKPHCYSLGHILDLYVVLYPSRGAASCHGVWVQPFGDGRTGFLQSVRLAA